MSGAAVIPVLSWVSLLAFGLTAVKLHVVGLRQRYPVFFYYLIFRVISAVCLTPLDVKSNAYFYLWVFSTPITLIFYGLVVQELCRLVLEKHKGLYTLGKWSMYAGIVVSVAISVVSLMAKFRQSEVQHGANHASPSNLLYVYAADRGVTCCLAVFLLLMLLLVSRYPVPLPRNVILHVSVYSVYFWSNTLSLIMMSVFGLHLFTAIDLTLMAISLICGLAWLFYITPAGEETRVNVPHFDPHQEERILLHLDALNSTLLKVSRK